MKRGLFLRSPIFSAPITLIFLMCLLFLSFLLVGPVSAGKIIHPMKNPPKITKGKCPNCGMMLNMWARTRHSFTLSEGNFETCSIRCMADMGKKAGEKPKDVEAALYLNPKKMVPQDDAFYVVGSSAKGTMTMVSKIAFDSEEKAQEFSAANRGTVMNYSKTIVKATKELKKSRPKITAKRKKMGKIKDPSEKDHCTVCNMSPAKYPNHRSQILTMTGNTLHFCSTKCLINYQADPQEYNKEELPGIKAVWVTVYPDGDYDYATGLYYVVGSKIMGPMGSEALPYRQKKAALATSEKQGGKVLRFYEIKPSMFEGMHMKPM